MKAKHVIYSRLISKPNYENEKIMFDSYMIPEEDLQNGDLRLKQLLTQENQLKINRPRGKRTKSCS